MAEKFLWKAVVSTAAAAVMSAAVMAQDNPMKGADPNELPEHRRKQIAAAAPEKPRVKPKKARKLLVFFTPQQYMNKDPHKGYNLPWGANAFKALGEKTGAYEPTITNDQVYLLPDNLKKFDAILLANTAQRWTLPDAKALEKIKKELGEPNLTAEAAEAIIRGNFIEYIDSGAGMMGYHFAVGGCGKWKEFHEMLGASYWGHPWNEEVGIKIDDPDHPLVQAFDGKSFRLKEEIFQFNNPYSRKKLRVLISLDVDNTNMGVKWINRKDNDFALAWVRSYGKGRVFYTALGHRAEIYTNPKTMQFYLDGIQFVLGDIEAPTEPSEK